MTDRSVASEVEVAVDPATAFAVFTEEMNLWWLRGPINNWDSARVVEVRCEPGVGGRLLEIYDEAEGDILALARITAWEPGIRLAWESSVDDVQIEVRFQAVGDGTRVRVEATIPAGGKDAGGTSFVRMTPPWFGAWCAKRDQEPHKLRDTARLALAVYYAKPGTAARWLHDVFGFELAGNLPESGDETSDWTEFRVGNCSLMVFKYEAAQQEHRPASHVAWVFVDDLDAHFAHAQAKGAKIVEGIHQHGYRAYIAEDVEGHPWTFAQARPTM
ncbi:MAG: VOC family protein [Candidatus Dormibacteraeota bacterium]|nr:VOC family protein [Candidatus Dormibacteraeota bacterium]